MSVEEFDRCEHDIPIIIACPKCNPEKYVVTQKLIDTAKEVEAEWHKDVLAERAALRAKVAEYEKEVTRLQEFEWMYKDLCK